jgi:hypothetical protein
MGSETSLGLEAGFNPREETIVKRFDDLLKPGGFE